MFIAQVDISTEEFYCLADVQLRCKKALLVSLLAL